MNAQPFKTFEVKISKASTGESETHVVIVANARKARTAAMIGCRIMFRGEEAIYEVTELDGKE